MRLHSLRNSIHIVVIGGNGFLGRSIIFRLSSYSNLRIYSLDKREHNVTIDTTKSKAVIQQVVIDISNEGVISAWLAAHPVDVIIYAAGYENPTDGLGLSSVEDTKALLGLNRTLASLHHIDLSPEEDRPYFLYISSWSVYGPQHKKKAATETSKEFPANHAGMNKLLGEDLVKRFCTKNNVPFCILRPTEIYGKHHNNELSNKVFWQGYLAYYVDKVIKNDSIEILGYNTEIDLVPINYFSKVVVECIKNKIEGIYNISSGNLIKVKDLVELIVSCYPSSNNRSIELKKSDKLLLEDMRVDSSKIQEIIPYNYKKYNLQDFIKAYIPLRQYEIGKNMAIEQALKEPVTLDMAAINAKESYNKRKNSRALEYKKIKKISGHQYFKINVGKIQDRSKEILGEEYHKDYLIAEAFNKKIDQKPLLLESEKTGKLKTK